MNTRGCKICKNYKCTGRDLAKLGYEYIKCPNGYTLEILHRRKYIQARLAEINAIKKSIWKDENLWDIIIDKGYDHVVNNHPALNRIYNAIDRATIAISYTQSSVNN